MDYEGLEYLSPNEREQYIKQSLDESRKRRIIEARKCYSSFTRSLQGRFSDQKRIWEERKAKILPSDTREKVKSDIAILEARLDLARANLGSAQSNAVDEQLKIQQGIVQLELAKAEQDILYSERFREAIHDIRKNHPKQKLKQRAERLGSAKSHAQEREKLAVSNFAKKVEKQRTEDRQQNEKAAAEHEAKFHVNLNDFARTFYHAGIGTIPVNQGAEAYERDIMVAEKIEEERKRRIQVGIKKRSEEAAFRHQTEKDEHLLKKELEMIRKIEKDEELDLIVNEPQKECQISSLYRMEEREAVRQARIQRFLAYKDDVPKPRGRAPEPQPLHMIMTSPIVSSDEEL
jgi:hypothetical protein